MKSANQVGTVSGAAAYLVHDMWDDFHFKVLFSLFVLSAEGKPLQIGNVKIAKRNMDDRGATSLASTFQILGEEFFSLGQDAAYYEALYARGAGFASNVLRGLRDLALDDALYADVQEEPVVRIALMRQVSQFEFEGQFRRAARGNERFERYKFRYTPPPSDDRDFDSGNLRFEVDPTSNPPTNVHAIIGRNGAGKTRLLQNMINSLLDAEGDSVAATAFDGGEDILIFGRLFANVVSVTFSAFDDFDPRLNAAVPDGAIGYHYVGLKNSGTSSDTDVREIRTKSASELSSDFTKSYEACREKPRRSRWVTTMSALGGDPGFSESGLDQLLSPVTAPETSTAAAVFGLMSSGHKVVTLTMTRLVEVVEERTLVLIDEPETHLHPPLLAAYMRALSELLKARNAVAIIATHSPVVLQEVPRSCVLRIRSIGRGTVVDRITRQSFGENVGVLTDEVFGLQVDASNYHDLVRRALEEYGSFEEAEESFDGGLGGEARALLQSMIADRSIQ